VRIHLILIVLLIALCIFVTPGCIFTTGVPDSTATPISPDNVTNAVLPEHMVNEPGNNARLDLPDIPTDKAPLRVFLSPEEARGFLKNHTVPYSTKQSFSRFSGSTGTLSVIECNGVRVFRYMADTSSFRPDEYIVTVNAINEDAWGAALFNVLEGTRSKRVSTLNRTEYVPVKGEKYYIRIDPVGDRYVGERFVISGSTNLPMGEDLLIQVYSSSFKRRNRDDRRNRISEFTGILHNQHPGCRCR
jgi:hypothetical protein